MFDHYGLAIFSKRGRDVEDVQHTRDVDEQRSFSEVTPGANPGWCISVASCKDKCASCDVPSTVPEDKRGRVPNASVELSITEEPSRPEDIWVFVNRRIVHACPCQTFSDSSLLR